MLILVVAVDVVVDDLDIVVVVAVVVMVLVSVLVTECFGYVHAVGPSPAIDPDWVASRGRKGTSRSTCLPVVLFPSQAPRCFKAQDANLPDLSEAYDARRIICGVALIAHRNHCEPFLLVHLC